MLAASASTWIDILDQQSPKRATEMLPLMRDCLQRKYLLEEDLCHRKVAYSTMQEQRLKSWRVRYGNEAPLSAVVARRNEDMKDKVRFHRRLETERQRLDAEMDEAVQTMVLSRGLWRDEHNEVMAENVKAAQRVPAPSLPVREAAYLRPNSEWVPVSPRRAPHDGDEDAGLGWVSTRMKRYIKSLTSPSRPSLHVREVALGRSSPCAPRPALRPKAHSTFPPLRQRLLPPALCAAVSGGVVCVLASFPGPAARAWIRICVTHTTLPPGGTDRMYLSMTDLLTHVLLSLSAVAFYALRFMRVAEAATVASVGALVAVSGHIAMETVGLCAFLLPWQLKLHQHHQQTLMLRSPAVYSAVSSVVGAVTTTVVAMQRLTRQGGNATLRKWDRLEQLRDEIDAKCVGEARRMVDVFGVKFPRAYFALGVTDTHELNISSAITKCGLQNAAKISQELYFARKTGSPVRDPFALEGQGVPCLPQNAGQVDKRRRHEWRCWKKIFEGHQTKHRPKARGKPGRVFEVNFQS